MAFSVFTNCKNILVVKPQADVIMRAQVVDPGGAWGLNGDVWIGLISKCCFRGSQGLPIQSHKAGIISDVTLGGNFSFTKVAHNVLR